MSRNEFHGLQCFGMGFILECPAALSAWGYHGSWLRRGGFLPGARLRPMAFQVPAGDALRLHFVTPLVSKHLDRGDPLLGPLRTRLQRLVNDYGDRERLVVDAAPWRVAEVRLRTAVIPRSAEAPRKVAGRKGWLRITHLRPHGALLLAAGGLTHAGGATSMGFGRYRWQQT